MKRTQEVTIEVGDVKFILMERRVSRVMPGVPKNAPKLDTLQSDIVQTVLVLPSGRIGGQVRGCQVRDGLGRIPHAGWRTKKEGQNKVALAPVSMNIFHELFTRFRKISKVLVHKIIFN